MCDDHYPILSSPFCGFVNECSCFLGRCSTRCCINSMMPSRVWATSGCASKPSTVSGGGVGRGISVRGRERRQLSGWEGEDSSESVVVDLLQVFLGSFSLPAAFLPHFSLLYFISVLSSPLLRYLLLSRPPFSHPTPSPPAPSDGEWTRLSHIEKVQKEMFFKQQKRASRGFMTQASLQLELLLEMSQDPRVARCLSLAPLGRRTAAAVSQGEWQEGRIWGSRQEMKLSVRVLSGIFRLRGNRMNTPTHIL